MHGPNRVPDEARLAGLSVNGIGTALPTKCGNQLVLLSLRQGQEWRPYGPTRKVVKPMQEGLYPGRKRRALLKHPPITGYGILGG
jgi:hypothetical protein